MNSRKPQGPRIIIDFTDELVRQLTAEQIKQAIKELLAEEALLDVKASAAFLSLSQSKFRRLSRKIPVVDLGERSARYRIKDLIAYRDKRTILPRS